MNHPVILNPKPRIQTLSNALQTPFYFGGSQVPVNLNLKNYNGSGLSSNFSTKNEKIYNQGGRIVVKPLNKRFVK